MLECVANMHQVRHAGLRVLVVRGVFTHGSGRDSATIAMNDVAGLTSLQVLELESLTVVNLQLPETLHTLRLKQCRDPTFGSLPGALRTVALQETRGWPKEQVLSVRDAVLDSQRDAAYFPNAQISRARPLPLVPILASWFASLRLKFS